MIYLYSGTPGSGKSLHVARVIYYTLMRGLPVICNFQINTNYVKHKELFQYVDNTDLNPTMLMDYSREYFAGKAVKEGQITLVIDEAQMLFNARSWDKADRDGWNKFFQIHRHFGYDIILVAQFDRMIDRQIRSLIEYEQIHRKVSNFGAKGKLLCALMLAPNLFVSVKVWYPMKERVDSEFFRASKRYYRLYDTYLLFDS
jgi:zona occludens toxin (predicted ATPase)